MTANDQEEGRQDQLTQAQAMTSEPSSPRENIGRNLRHAFQSYRAQSVLKSLRSISRWYNAWFTLISLLVTLPAATLFLLGWWVSLTEGKEMPKGTRLADITDASSFALLVLVVMGGFCLARAQATPKEYEWKAKRYRLAADSLFRSSITSLTAVLYGLLAQLYNRGEFKKPGDTLYTFWAFLGSKGEAVSLLFAGVAGIFVILAIYQYMRVLFREMDEPENI